MTKKGSPLSLNRRKATRVPRKKFVVFCEGRNTEPIYFGAVGHMFRDTLVEIETEPAAGVPMTMARSAVRRAEAMGLLKKGRRRMNSFEESDQVWVVFDRDEHPNFAEAVDMCNANGIGVGRSDPCFEVWLILHFEEYDRAGDRNAAQKRLEKLCSEYSSSKGKRIDCSRFMPALDKAEERAVRQLERRAAEGVPYGPPSTTVFSLIRAIRSASDASKR